MSAYSIRSVTRNVEKDEEVIVIDQGDGNVLTLHVPITHGLFSVEQTKESPHDEEIVEAGTEFLMKVTEEAVLDALDQTSPFSFDREANREFAQDVVHKRLTAYINGEEVTTDPHREEDPEPVPPVYLTRSLYGVHSHPRGLVKMYGPDDEISYEPPRIEAVNRYDPKIAGYEEYLDQTQGK